MHTFDWVSLPFVYVFPFLFLNVFIEFSSYYDKHFTNKHVDFLLLNGLKKIIAGIVKVFAFVIANRESRDE